MDAREGEFRASVERACAIMAGFAEQQGWSGLVQDCFFDSAEVFSEQAALKQRILGLHGLPPETPLPDGVVAALEKRVLLAVTPEINARLNPAYAVQDDAWDRLLAHEMVHRLHIAVLGGDEDAMGPQWFYEGFAVVGSGQQLGEPLEYASAEAALEGALDSESEQAYRRFGAAVRFFARRIALAELVEQASNEDFEGWLQSRDRSP